MATVSQQSVAKVKQIRQFIPLEEQLPEDLQADEVLVPFPVHLPQSTPAAEGLSYPDWLARLGCRETEGNKH